MVMRCVFFEVRIGFSFRNYGCLDVRPTSVLLARVWYILIRLLPLYFSNSYNNWKSQTLCHFMTREQLDFVQISYWRSLLVRPVCL
jgi:hypothetical protein